MSEALEVSLDLDGITVEVGVAYFHRRRGTITTDFTYNPDYLATRAAYAIDPALPMDVGRGVVDGLPGAFSDCSPDRWGRRLITKRLRAGEAGGGARRTLSDVDFLLGVSDLTRQGALRFRLRGETEFVERPADVPKVVQLPQLLRAADLVARDDDSSLSAIKILLDAGTGTLGGARPKASVVGDGGLLYIAKFPHPTDDWDVMAWEKTALDLAEKAGLDVPRRLTAQVDGRTVLLLERFDRRNGERIGYMSAMTMIGGRDGDDGWDYVDLAAELSDVSAATDDDLAELWRRIAFSVAVHNTDDHLRNHGLLRAGGGWRLSPVFDVNPNPDVAEERSTSIGGAAARPDELGGLMVNAKHFGLSARQARVILGDVSAATRGWRKVAASNGIPTAGLNRFENTFEGLRDEMDRICPDQD